MTDANGSSKWKQLKSEIRTLYGDVVNFGSKVSAFSAFDEEASESSEENSVKRT